MNRLSFRFPPSSSINRETPGFRSSYHQKDKEMETSKKALFKVLFATIVVILSLLPPTANADIHQHEFAVCPYLLFVSFFTLPLLIF